MMNFQFHPEALQEYIEATNYYREISPSLSNAFVMEVENSINQILLYPQAWQPLDDGVRRCLVKRFPFGIYYTVEDNKFFTIQAVMHLSRKPGYWKERTAK
jgi:plasmid stabilization system protein ParE